MNKFKTGVILAILTLGLIFSLPFVYQYLSTPHPHITGCEKTPLNDAKYIQSLADNGDAEAQYELAMQYNEQNSKYGAAKWTRETNIWLVKAAKQGHLEAQHQLCVEYMSLWMRANKENPPPDNKLQWCITAAEHGNHNAQGILGGLYYSGHGVQQSYKDAYFWFSLAGYVRKKEATQHLSAKEISEIEARIKKWTPLPTAIPPQKHTPPNFAGLLCGGITRDCHLIDSCGNFSEAVCSDSEFYFLNNTTKMPVSSCTGCQGCETAIPKEWTCGWPKDAPKKKQCSVITF